MKKKQHFSASGIVLPKLYLPVFILFCVFLLFSNESNAAPARYGYQTNNVKGVIKSEAGQPLEGVSISIQGNAGSGAISITGGEYQIDVKPNTVLIYSFTGYLSQEVNIGDRSIVDIALKADLKGMEEVVVVGYGTQRRRDITGAVASVPKDRLEMVPNLNVAQVLQGAVAGVMIQQVNAGSVPNNSIMIRGRNSILASNDPLIVVDGVPYSGGLMDINPNDLKSIEVLKDASASAIYGSRGANGVILITTKTGITGKPVITYDGRYATQSAINVPYFMDGKQFHDFKEIREPNKLTTSEKAIYDAGKSVNWADLALRNGNSQQHNLSIAGGFQNTNYLIGGSYLGVKGLAVNDAYQRVTSRVNFETQVRKWLKVGTRTQLSFENKEGHPLDWVTVFNTNPLTTAYEANGDLTLYPWPEFIDIRNPLEAINYDYSNKANQILTNNYAIIKLPFVDGLSYRLNTGIRRKYTDISNYIGRNTASGLEAGGIGNTARGVEKSDVIENIFSYDKNFGKHSVFATAAFMYERNSTSNNIVDARGFPNDFTTYYAMSQASFIAPLNTFFETTLMSQMLRLNYAYNGKYLLTLTGRRDGYSGFGSSSKWGNFPSVAAGWNIDSEDFFPWKQTFDKLKLRISYGLNGNQAVGPYQTLSRYVPGNIVSLGITQPGYIPGSIGLDNLGWESSKSFNLGLDFGLFKNRISGDVNYFNTNTFDLLLNRSISAVNGLTSITQNIGETNNTGFEVSINTQNILTRSFTWSTVANLSYVENKIKSLYGIIGADGKEINDLANNWFIGQPVRVNYDYLFTGVWQQKESAEATQMGSVPGNAKLQDLNKDGKINFQDRQVIGQQDPKFLWGLTNTFTYQHFTLTAFIHGVHGLTRLNQNLQDASSSSEVRRNVLGKNWWTPDNPTNDFYRNALNAEKMQGISAAIYENASFVRVKDITLSYDFPLSTISKGGLSMLRLYMVGRNLFTFSDWTGGDPELVNGRGTYPLQKELVFGLTLNF